MEDSYKNEFSAQLYIEFFQKLVCELRAMVRDDRKRQLIQSHYLFHRNLSQLMRIILYYDKNEVV